MTRQEKLALIDRFVASTISVSEAEQLFDLNPLNLQCALEDIVNQHYTGTATYPEGTKLVGTRYTGKAYVEQFMSANAHRMNSEVTELFDVYLAKLTLESGV